MKERLQEKLFLDTPSFWLVPPHIVQVRRTANDTEIPGFEMDWETLELQCDWRGMFTALLSEQKLTGSLVRTWVSSSHLILDSSTLSELRTFTTVSGGW